MATETTNDKLHSQVTYDFNKVITGIDVNPAYIHGLQRICNAMIINSDRGIEMPGIFKKFETIVAQNELEEKDREIIQLDIFEADIYTLFSLIQLFKFKALDQGLEIKTETTVTKAELADLAKMVERGEDTVDALKKINAKMTIVK
jgi:hypothetical protein